jgi:predicted secreted protein
MNAPEHEAKKLKAEFQMISDLHKDLNKTLEDLHELLRLSHDLKDSLKYTGSYFNTSTIKRVKVSALKWREAIGRFKEKTPRIDTDLFEKEDRNYVA